MHRMLWTLLLVTLLGACSWRQQEPTHPQARTDRTVVMLVHGIGGNHTHFGHMRKALLRHLHERAAPGRTYDVVPFDYDTASNDKDTQLFARELGEAVRSHLGVAPRATDKISLVCHSQGGLIGAIWMYRALRGEAAYHPELLPHVDAFITLATPFWGAKIASAILPIKDMPVVGHTISPLPFFMAPGHTQLREMSFGSDTIHAFRQAAMTVANNPMDAQRINHVRLLNVGGYVGWFPPNPWTLGEEAYEDDTAVVVPSSRAGFIHGQAVERGYEEGAVLGSDRFREVRPGPFALVNAIHLALTVDLPQPGRGIAQVHRRCVGDAECDHPVYPMVLAHLLGQTVTPDETHLHKMTGFLLDVDVTGIQDGAQASVEFAPPPKGVRVGRPMELYSAGRSFASRNPGHQRFYFTGTITRSYVPPPRPPGAAEFADKAVRFTVHAKGYKTRVVEARVRATYSTYVEVRLERALTPAVP